MEWLLEHWPYLLAGLVACACAVGAMIRNAPTGWEDEAGFHLGEWDDEGSRK